MRQDRDRRRAVRVRVVAVATLETRDRRHSNDQALSCVKNVSRTGIGVETGQPPRIGQTVVLRLALGDTMHELHADVTRVERRGVGNFHHVGLDWSACTEEQRTFLDEVLAAVEDQRLA